MNCDEAFEHLTDPALRNHVELHWHLDMCPRCRQMQETLSPALELFDPPAGFSESHFQSAESHRSNRPESVGFLSPETVELAERSAARLASRAPAPPSTGKSYKHVLLSCAVGVLIGASVTFGLVGFGLHPEQSAAGPHSAADQQCSWKLPGRSKSDLKAESREVVRSCVVCHLGGSLH